MELAQVITLQEQREVTPEHLSNWINALSTPSDSERTRQAYAGAIRQLLGYLSAKGITKPEAEDLLEWKRYLTAKDENGKPTHTPGTTNLYLTATRLFFTWLESRRIYSNIASGLKGLTLSKEHKKQALKSHQAAQVIATATSLRDKAILSVMFRTGLRCTEVRSADFEDLVVIAGTPAIKVLRKGKTEKQFLPLEDEAYKDILAYTATKEKHTGALFTGESHNTSRGSRLSTRSISGVVKAALRKAGYDSPQLTAHSTRHSFATIAFDAGASVEQVSQMLGHANINTTMIYIHQRELMANPCPSLVSEAISRGAR